MNDQIPYWIKVLGALGPCFAAFATLVVGMIVAAVAHRQWRTAHDKVVLDLFDRRWKVFEKVVDGIDYFFSGSSTITHIRANQVLTEAYSQSLFLFGSEVSDAIIRLRDDVARLQYFTFRKDGEDLSIEERNKMIESAVELDTRINLWKQPFIEVCNPYMRMDHKTKRAKSAKLDKR